MFSKHSACRREVIHMLNDDDLVKKDRYLENRDGSILTFSVTYALDCDEEVNERAIVARISSDMMEKKVINNTMELERVSIEDIIPEITVRVVFRVLCNNFICLEIDNNKQMRNAIREMLRTIHDEISLGNAIVVPKLNNRFITEHNDLTYKAHLFPGYVFNEDQAMFARNYIRERIVDNWEGRPIFNRNLLVEYVVEVKREQAFMDFVLNVFARARQDKK